jgi:hypothetical protein
MILPSSAMPTQSLVYDAQNEGDSRNERFNTTSTEMAPQEHELDSERTMPNERFDIASHPIGPQSMTSAPDGDDDSPPPTHFVEIKLPPAAPAPAQAERPAQPAYSTAAAARAEPAPKAAWTAELEPAAVQVSVPIALPPVAQPELPKISLELPPDSNLVLVETSRHQSDAPTSDQPETARPRRVRPPRVEVKEEPLQLVETAHKDPGQGA